MLDSTTKEKNLLVLSIAIALLCAITGVTIGWVIDSLAIIFDGVYSLVSVALTFLSLGAVLYIRRDNISDNLKRVKIIESIVLFFKGIGITLMCLLSFIAAVEAIFIGGREINSGAALAFSIFNMLVCYISYWIFNSKRKTIRSALIDAEADQWFMDTIISLAIFIGFIIAKILLMTSYTQYALLADPIMVVAASVYFIFVPVRIMVNSIKQLYQIHQDDKYIQI